MGKEEIFLFVFYLITGLLIIFFRYKDESKLLKFITPNNEESQIKKETKKIQDDYFIESDIIKKAKVEEFDYKEIPEELLEKKLKKSEERKEIQVKKEIESSMIKKEETEKNIKVYKDMVFVKGDEIIKDGKKYFVDSFYIDKYEVTVRDYKKFNKNYVPPDGFDNDLLPVVNISYYEAEQYAKSIGKRLPTENEWILAARGNSNLIYPFGNIFDKSKGRLECQWEEGPDVIGQYPPNINGIYDLSGNVWEWTSSRYEKTFEVNKEYFILKGGSWYYSKENCKVESRRIEQGNFTAIDIGFRCVR